MGCLLSSTFCTIYIKRGFLCVKFVKVKNDGVEWEKHGKLALIVDISYYESIIV